jgi:antitoxin StbD
MDELDDLRIELAARERLAGFDRTKALSHEEMLKRFAAESDA